MRMQGIEPRRETDQQVEDSQREVLGQLLG
jgi:hypothetical protein